MPEYRFEGFLKGSRLSPLRIAELCYDAGWRELELVKAVAVCLAESAGYTRAHNIKTHIARGAVVSMDRGLFQIKIDADQLDSSFAERLWEPEFNVRHAKKMYDSRGWQPWYAFTNGIALDPKFRGRYVQRATWAVMNLYRKQLAVPQVPSPYVRLGGWRLTRWLRREMAA